MSMIVSATGAFSVGGSNQITGAISFEETTHEEIGVTLPINSGFDTDHEATVTVRFRETGVGVWQTAQNLERVRPEFASVTRINEFAGTIFGCQPNVWYEVECTISHPTEQGGVEVSSITTREMPKDSPDTENLVLVSNPTELQTALTNASPGDRIELTDSGTGIFDIGTGVFTINASGTAANPIFISGVDRDAITIRGSNTSGTGQFFQINGSYVTVEDLTFENTGSLGYAIRADSQTDQRNIVIRRCKINSERGIRCWTGTMRHYSIYRNELTGIHTWPDISSTTWDSEGIRIEGQGQAVFENVLSGYGDSLSLKNDGNILNRAIWFYRNRILWGGDDALELDDAVANCGAYDNLAGNSATLFSCQHNSDTGGPVYCFRNVGINLARRPFKLNDGPTGVNIWANTVYVTLVNVGTTNGAWSQFGGDIRQADVQANLFVVLNMTRILVQQAPYIQSLTTFDNNGYTDGTFIWSNQGAGSGTYTSLSQYQSSSSLPFDKNSVVVTGTPSQIFDNPPTLGADYTTLTDISNLDGLVLASGSSAIGQTVELANIND